MNKRMKWIALATSMFLVLSATTAVVVALSSSDNAIVENVADIAQNTEIEDMTEFSAMGSLEEELIELFEVEEKVVANVPQLNSSIAPNVNAYTPVVYSAQSVNSWGYDYAAEDLDATWNASAATTIKLNSNSIQVTGSGAAVSGTMVTISKAGTYVVSGTLNDGQILIDAGKNDIVKLVLNGVTISNSKSAPIYAKKAAKTVITLAKGTQNVISDATNYVYAEGEDEPDAAIFSKKDLSINGEGSLTVTGNFKNGIGTKDVLCITGGNITVTAVNDGLRGRDAVAILEGNFVIKSGNDGIKSNNDEKEDKGFIVVDGGTFQINSSCDGIQAETSLTINTGNFEIFTGGGAANAPVQQGNNNFGGRGFSAPVTTTTDSESMKALKAGTNLIVNGGTFVIDAEDDGVHANGDVIIEGGNFTISTGDDGFHADNKMVINDGVIKILTCYEGIEGTIVEINGGYIDLKASDDGINAAGGTDVSQGGMMRGDSFRSNSSRYIRITGGTIIIDSTADGLDSNGNLYIDGGTVYINGPTVNMEAAIDADGTVEINGGEVVAVGSSGMLSIPASTSGQPTLVVIYTSNQNAGSTLSLRDQSGKIVVEFTTKKSYLSAVISSPEIELGKTYSLYSDNTKLCDVTPSQNVTRISSNGSAISTGGAFGRGR